MGWTQEEFDKLTTGPDFKAKVVVQPESTRPNQEYRKKEKRSPTLPKVPVSSPAGISHIKGILKVLGVKFETEYMFDETGVREFRFDICVLDMKLAIEYEGIFSDKSGHTTAGGYIKDCVKYNLAATQGWRILRYTGNNYKQFTSDFNKLTEHDTARRAVT